MNLRACPRVNKYRLSLMCLGYLNGDPIQKNITVPYSSLYKVANRAI